MATVRVDLYASVPKDPYHPHLNEDVWLASEAGRRWALSDGASESYDSRSWAHALVARYVVDPGVNADWIEKAASEYARSVDFSALSWARQAAYERGSFSTLLGVELAENGTDLEVLAIGDSLAMHVRNGHSLASYPYSAATEFPQHPQLLSTLPAANRFVRSSDFVTRYSARTWSVEPGDHVYLMTDAVGQWLLQELNHESGSLAMLEQLTEDTQFFDLINSLRKSHRIKLDDSTLVRLVVEE